MKNRIFLIPLIMVLSAMISFPTFAEVQFGEFGIETREESNNYLKEIIIFTDRKNYSYNVGLKSLMVELEKWNISGISRPWTKHRVYTSYKQGLLKPGDRYLVFNSKNPKSCYGKIYVSLYVFTVSTIDATTTKIDGKKIKDYQVDSGRPCFKMARPLALQIVEDLTD
uniref:Uncharacterized protein n=1 Tax=Candidatus Kentrum sp. TUN TaxID=2126343 RepID=A0A450ZSF9_9GAMM|nr:MAG: hypothetical protein BECKTUN1418D_GA0071000_10524 [Candidatus Kentron sp. TUN]